MNQQYAEKRHVFVLLTLVGAILMGLVWLASVHSARAQGTLLLNTSYKDANPRNVGAGGTVAYSIILNNDSLSTTTTIEVNDPLAPELTYVSYSAHVVPEGAGFGFPSGSGVQFTVDPIATGGTVTLSFQATVATSVLPDDIITNTATITEGGLSFTRFVTVTVEDYPSVQIDEPWNNQLFTTRGTFTIAGRAWTGDEPGFPEPPDLYSISNNGGLNDWYTVSWDSVPGAVAYILQESTDPYFSQIRNEYTVIDATSKYIEDQPRGYTYYYRAKTRTETYESRWSAVQSVMVNPLDLLYQQWNVAPVVPSVAPLAAATAPTVEVNIKKVGVVQPDNWQQATTITADPTGDWWDWTYAWSLPTEDDAEYDIQVRAKGVNGGFNPEKIDTVRVTIRNGTRYVYLPVIRRRYPPIPYAPLLTLPSNDAHGNYQLSWSYSPATDPYKPTSYTFQEATNASFTSPTELTLSAATLSKSYTDKAVGTYYYRVRGNNTYGAGPWSNVQTVVVQPKGFFDDFSSTATGWPRQVFNLDGRGVLDANYDGGYYRMKILWNQIGLNNKRMGVLPAPYSHADRSYDLQVIHRFVKAADEGGYSPAQGKAGLIFLGTRTNGGTGYFETFHVVEWNFEGRCAISGYTNYTTDFGYAPYVPAAYLPRGTNDEFVYLNWGGWNDPPCAGLQAGYDNDVTVRVEVRDTQFSVFFNGHYIGTYSFRSGLPGQPYVGLITGSWEITPVQSRFDNFRVTDK
ncbi:MAG: DUF11 domain-containing protein [Anaerolineae bacterium]|nr:DUF11 domain-containing protein [Anaerolineae bacterium]